MKNKEKKTKENIFKTILNKASSTFKKKKKTTTEKQPVPTPQKPKAPFKILLCITFSSNGKKILNIFSTKNIYNSMIVKGYGTAHTSMLSMLGINETERDVVVGLIKAEDSKNIVANMVNEFEKIGIKNTFCCLLSPSSANVDTIKTITEANIK